MTEQYLRNASLIVGDASGNALDLSQMRIQFMVRNGSVQTLKQADIRIYNLSDATAKQIESEFTQVQLQVGYAGNLSLIFRGTICWVYRGRLNATDSYVRIIAQDGDEAYNFAVVNQTLSAGWDPSTVFGAVAKSMSPYGVTTGYSSITGNPAPRGKVLFGMARDRLRCLADSQHAGWGIENSTLNLVPYSTVMPGTVPALNAQTGMLGVPEQTIQGIIVRCLLNPDIRSFGKLQIDNSAITSLTVKQQLTGSDVVVVPSKDWDGFYVAHCVTHQGDTRGNEWQTEAICIAVDGTAPANGPTIQDVPSGY